MALATELTSSAAPASERASSMRPSSASSCPAASRSAISSKPVRSCTENGRIASACCSGSRSGPWPRSRRGELQAEPDVAGAVVGSPGAVDLGRRAGSASRRVSCRAGEPGRPGADRTPRRRRDRHRSRRTRRTRRRPRRRRDRARRRWSIGWDGVEQLLRGGHDGRQLLGGPEISSPSSSLPLRTATAMAPKINADRTMGTTTHGHVRLPARASVSPAARRPAWRQPPSPPPAPARPRRRSGCDPEPAAAAGRRGCVARPPLRDPGRRRTGPDRRGALPAPWRTPCSGDRPAPRRDANARSMSLDGCRLVGRQRAHEAPCASTDRRSSSRGHAR